MASNLMSGLRLAYLDSPLKLAQGGVFQNPTNPVRRVELVLGVEVTLDRSPRDAYLLCQFCGRHLIRFSNFTLIGR